MTEPRVGWVLYDGECGFCSRFVPAIQGMLARRGFEIAPLQTPWVKERVPIPEKELLDEIRLLLNDGRVISGADAFLFVMKRIPWTWPLAALFSLPGLKQLFWWGYRKFASNRYLVSKVCRMPPKRWR